jgi:hypothetical protein
MWLIHIATLPPEIVTIRRTWETISTVNALARRVNKAVLSAQTQRKVSKLKIIGTGSEFEGNVTHKCQCDVFLPCWIYNDVLHPFKYRENWTNFSLKIHEMLSQSTWILLLTERNFGVINPFNDLNGKYIIKTTCQPLNSRIWIRLRRRVVTR